MEELQMELEKLTKEHGRLRQASEYLRATHAKATIKLAEMGKQLPDLMVSAALGETAEDALDRFKSELRNLREITQNPTLAAITILNARIKSIFEEMAKIQHNLDVIERKARYLDARSAIAAKGFFTVQEHETLEHLASNSGEGIDFTRFTQAIEEYRGHRALSGQPSEYPPFVYIPVGIAA